MRRPAEMMILSTIVLVFGALLVEASCGCKVYQSEGKGSSLEDGFSISGQATYRAVGLPKLRGALSRTQRDSEVANAELNPTGVSVGPYIEVLHGRDGRDGRGGTDGERGETGNPGEPSIQQCPTSGGVVYTRWGRTTCPTQGTELLYKGIAGGSGAYETGGGANYLCLPEEPEYSDYQHGAYNFNYASYLEGAEYESKEPAGPFSSVFNHNVPCAVCYVPVREAVLMLPARLTCPPNWTLEYNGYLMANCYEFYRTTYECMDKDPESIPGSSANTNGVQFYFIEAICNGLPCPPYDTQKEVTCAVCSK